MIAFVGMTHLGLVSAVAAASKGFQVLCFDPEEETIERLNSHNISISEPRLLELMTQNKDKLIFSSNVEDLKKCKLVYIAPDIPTDSLSQSDLTSIESLIKLVTKHLSKDTVLVILSQVPPGFTRKIEWRPLYYQVETLIFGKAIERALYPERFIIGALDPKKISPSLCNFLETFHCPILPMSFESAELAKIAINMYLVSSVTTTNTIASLCEKTNANFSEIAVSLRLDKRIGPHAYLQPGLGIAGGNLERDLATFCALSDQHGTDAQIVRAWQRNSGHQSDWVLRTIYEKVFPHIPNPRFGILGLAYKKDTNSIKNSPALKLLKSLSPFEVFAFDPIVKNVPHTHPKMRIAETAEDVIRNSDTILVMTPWDQFQQLSPSCVKDKIVIDPFKVIACPSKVYFTMGAK